MKKTYENPMLQIVSINKNDIIATSLDAYDQEAANKGGDITGFGFAPGRNFDSWYEGY
ncbi:MAG: hypothetical protein IKN59_03840 [Paludibacteraceae bacterium]|nr:hypothetical protein [Paludibacteraceae bacterium]